MRTKNNILGTCIGLLFATSLYGQSVTEKDFAKKASETLATIENRYAVPDGKFLFRETYPFDNTYSADYLGGGENQHKTNPYSYLWPFSGSLSAYVALLEHTNDKSVKKHVDKVVLPGLENYYDTRVPSAYASYINSAKPSDRFYDDNVWLGIDFADLYLHTKEQRYLDKSKEIWTFVESGMDEQLGGGIYWCEQKKESKNTCSNAPAVVYLLKLYEATASKHYLAQAKELYDWTKRNLEDPSDKLYWDNISLSGKIQKTKYPYNTGQMIQAGALLYKHTSDEKYLHDAQQSAKSGLDYFFTKDESTAFPLLKQSNNWFIAIMLRGYIELYQQDKDASYVKVFQANLNHAWKNMRDADGLFGKKWSGKANDNDKKWLLDQFAIAEMYARLADLKSY